MNFYVSPRILAQIGEFLNFVSMAPGPPFSTPSELACLMAFDGREFIEGMGKGFAPGSDKKSPETHILLGSSGSRLQANLIS
jgi:hypothetical protein